MQMKIFKGVHNILCNKNRSMTMQRRVFDYRLYISHQTVHYHHLEETTYNINIAPFFFLR